MLLKFDIHCDDHTNEPSYRVFLNEDLLAERDYVIPDDRFSHYKFLCDVNLQQGNNVINIESLDGPSFTIKKLAYNDKTIDGVWVNEGNFNYEN
jgi:hypothetical protein|tara:strand:+ start:118 stop:399 length:282 start_codon:yes stop_codon:yes gene_type:complete